MKRVNYNVKIPSDVIDRGINFIESHPGVEIEDYLRAQVVLYSTRPSNLLGNDLDEEEFSGKEMLFSLNLSFEKSLKIILEDRFIGGCHSYIRMACARIDKELNLANKNTLQDFNLILKSL